MSDKKVASSKIDFKFTTYWLCSNISCKCETSLKDSNKDLNKGKCLMGFVPIKKHKIEVWNKQR